MNSEDSNFTWSIAGICFTLLFLICSFGALDTYLTQKCISLVAPTHTATEIMLICKIK